MNKKRILAMVLTLAIVLGLLPSTMLTVSAATAAPTAFTQTAITNAVNSAGNGGMLDLSGLSASPTVNVTITIPESWTFTIRGNSSVIFGQVAIVCEGNNALTIDNLNIKSLSGQSSSALRFTAGINTLTLVGTNAITNGQAILTANYGAAVGVPKDVTLTIAGSGALTATSGYGGAGIGTTGDGTISGDITISGGTVTARGSTTGAGIGGSAITITGGTVEAAGGTNGPGISGATITISSGSVTATGGGTSVSGYNCVGIGGRKGKVTISGGTVTATGGVHSAGIGGGGIASIRDNGNIIISDGTVTATGGVGGAGIGGGGTPGTAGNAGSGGDITISGGTVTATGGSDGAGIGGGSGTNIVAQTDGSSGTITITGGKVKATRGVTGASSKDIGNGAYWSGVAGTLTITGGSVWPGSTSSGSWFSAGMPKNGTGTGAVRLYRLTVTNNAIDSGSDITSGSYKAPIDHDGNKSYLWLPMGMNLVTANVQETLQRQNASVASNHSSQLEFVTDWTWEQVQPAIDNAKDDDTIYLSGLSTPSSTTYSTLTIPEGKKLTIKGDNTSLSNTSIECKGNNELTIENLNIKSATDQVASALRFTAGSNTLTLAGTNAITNGQTTSETNYGAAVGVPTNVTLTIAGDGALTAIGGYYGVGIGGAGDITISSGTVTATGNLTAAGIGGRSIGIIGGTVTATGGGNGSGISGSTITISSGTVTAKGGGSSSDSGAGIGGRVGAVVTISGGMVTATGGYNSAGIGGSSAIKDNGTITIEGGTVTATGGYGGAGIGGGGTIGNAGNGGTGGVITINGGTVTGTGGESGAGIGGGSGTNTNSLTGGGGGTITITGGKVKATRGGGSTLSRDIGTGGLWSAALSGAAGTITITGGSVWPGSATSSGWFNSGMPTNGTGQLYRLTVINDGVDSGTNITSDRNTYTYTAPIDHDGNNSYLWFPVGDVTLTAMLNSTGNNWEGYNTNSNEYTMTLSSHANALVKKINDYASGEGKLEAVNSGNNTVTVTGTRTGVTSMLALTIDSSVTVIWNAKISGTINGSDGIISLSGGGTFEVGTDGLISNAGSGRAIYATADEAVVNVNGGTVSAAGGYAIHAHGSSVTVNVSDGTVEATATNGYAFYLAGSNATVTVSGGTVKAVATGRTIYAAAGSNGSIVILGGTIEAGSPATTTSCIGKDASSEAKGYYIGDRKAFFDMNFADITLFDINTAFTADEVKYTYDANAAQYYYVVAKLSDKFNLDNATVTVKNADGMYAMTDGGRTVTFNQVMNADSITFTISGAKIGDIALPDFTMPAFGVNIENDPSRIDIDKATITLVQNYSYIYTGGKKTPGIEVYYEGSKLTANDDYTLEFSDNINVGTATVTVLGIYSYTGAKKETFTITPKPLTIVGATHTKEYDGEITASGISLELSGIVPADSSNLSVDSVTAAYTNKDAGTTTVDITDATLTGKASGNYTVTPKNGVTVVGIRSKSVSITPAEGQSKKYGEDDPVFTYTNTDLIGDDKISVGAISHNGKDVGTHSFTIGTLSAGSNYALALSGGATFEIKQATVDTIKTVVSNVQKTAFEAKEADTTAGIANLAELPSEVEVETNVGKTATLPIEWETQNSYNAQGTTYTFKGTLTGNTNIGIGDVTKSVTVRITATRPTTPEFAEAFALKDSSNSAATVAQLGTEIFPTSGSVDVLGEMVDYTIAWGEEMLDLRYEDVTQEFTGTISYTSDLAWLTLPSGTTVTREVKVVGELPTYTLAFEENTDPSDGFADLTYGYTTGSSVTYTIRNTGNQTINGIVASIIEDDGYFTVGTPSETTLAPNETATVTVTSATGLVASETEYIGTLEIITWTGGKGSTGITKSLSQTVNKAVYTGTKTVRKNVLPDTAVNGITVTLPAIPDGAGYDSITCTTNGLVTGTPSITSGTLTFDVASNTEDTTDTITIPVTDAANFKDYEITVAVTTKTNSATLSGDITGYTGVALTGTQDVIVTLTGDTFAASLTGNWITSLPAGLTQSVTRVGDTIAKITVSGSPEGTASEQIAVIIPSGALVNNTTKSIVATSGDEATYYIQKAAYTLAFEGKPDPSDGFAGLTYGDTTGSSVTYTVKNTGNQTINSIAASISAGDGYFTVGALSKTKLAPEETATVTVTSKTGLNANEAATAYSGTLEITWMGGDSAGITQHLSQKVGRANYTDQKTASKNVLAGIAASGITVTLPTIPDNAKYGSIEVTSNGLVTGTPSITSGTLTFAVASAAAETTDTITIRVTNAINYNDYDIEVEVTAKAISAALSGNVTGYTDVALGTQEVTVTLTGDMFADLLTGNWITNLPAGLTQSVTRVSDTTAKITVSGTPTATSSAQIAVTIPSGALATNSGTSIVATASDVAKYNIQSAAYTLEFESNTDPNEGFADLTYGYAIGSSVTYTIKNTGNQTINDIAASTSAGSDYFTVGALSKATLAPGGTATVTVTSKTGLNASEMATAYSGTLKITWTGGDGSTGITKSLSQKVDKANYTSTKTASKNVLAETAERDINVTLPAIPSGADYGSITVTSEGLVTGMPSITNDTLTFDVASKTAETTDTITIRVTNATNYNDYNITVTVTAIANSATLSVSGNVTGYVGAQLTGTQEVTLTLTGDTFAASLTSNWITNLPAGLEQSVMRESDTTAKITVSGMPTATSSEQIAVTIPVGALTTNSGTSIVATASDAAKYDIQAIPDALEFKGNPEPSTGFAALTYGYATGSSVTYTVKNTGNDTITGIAASTSAGGDYFTAGTPSKTTLAPDETATVTITSTTGLDASATAYSGTLKITWTGGDGSTGITQSLSQTVNKATVSITADNMTAKTGDAAPTYTYKVTGLASGETLKTAPKLTCVANMSIAGTYTITPSDAVAPDGGNYNDIVYGNGILTVNKSMPAAPPAPTVKGAPTTTSITLNTIAGAQYSRNAGAAWQDSPVFTGLTQNTEYTFIARIKATANSFASANGPASAKIKTAAVPVQQYTIKATSNNTKYGTVMGGKAYTKGASVILTAKPKAGYRFVRWTEGSKTVSSSYQYKFTAQKNRTFKAEFAKIGVPKLKTSRKNATSIKVSWSKITGANSYQVYRKGPGEKKYKLIKTVKTVSYTDKKLKKNKSYSYKIRVKSVAGKTTTYGKYSAVKTVK